jgi:hypothetical protein
VAMWWVVMWTHVAVRFGCVVGQNDYGCPHSVGITIIAFVLFFALEMPRAFQKWFDSLWLIWSLEFHLHVGKYGRGQYEVYFFVFNVNVGLWDSGIT